MLRERPSVLVVLAFTIVACGGAHAVAGEGDPDSDVHVLPGGAQSVTSDVTSRSSSKAQRPGSLRKKPARRTLPGLRSVAMKSKPVVAWTRSHKACDTSGFPEVDDCPGGIGRPYGVRGDQACTCGRPVP
jgi:hypothetical protein